MIEKDWPSIEAVLKGVWPRRDLQPASLYLKLLEPFAVEDVRAALRKLAGTLKYAPSPAELLQALVPTPSAEDRQAQQMAYLREVTGWIVEHYPRLVRDALGPHPAAVVAVIRLHHSHKTRRLNTVEHGDEFSALVKRLRRDVFEESAA